MPTQKRRVNTSKTTQSSKAEKALGYIKLIIDLFKLVKDLWDMYNGNP
jgi:hypothetical protein